MSLRLPILIIGVTGTATFLVIGASGILPWEFAGSVSAALLIGWVFSEVKEQLKTKKGSIEPKASREPELKPKPEPVFRPVPESVVEEIPEGLHETGVLVDSAVEIEPKEMWEHGVALRKGDSVRIEVNADEPVDIDLVTRPEREKIIKSRTYTPERSRTWVRNATMEFDARRTGLWFVLVKNPNRKPVEAGVKISVEEKA